MARRADPQHPRFAGDSRRLFTNYRSVQPILDLATHVIRSDAQFADEPDLEAHAGAGHERSVCCIAPHAGGGGAVRCLEHLAVHAQGTAVVGHRHPHAHAPPSGRVRAGAALAGIPYVTAGGYGFFDREEVKDVMAYLAVIDNPLDDEARPDLQGPLMRVSDGELYRSWRARRRRVQLRHHWDRAWWAENAGCPSWRMPPLRASDIPWRWCAASREASRHGGRRAGPGGVDETGYAI